MCGDHPLVSTSVINLKPTYAFLYIARTKRVYLCMFIIYIFEYIKYGVETFVSESVMLRTNYWYVCFFN